MVSDQIPEVRFDLEGATTFFPRPVAKTAVLVPIPRTEDGSELPTFIRAEWGALQVFYGSYFAIVKDGVVIYGSAEDQWRAMHSQVSDMTWVKTAAVHAYRATETCRIVTLIPSEDGGIREANYTLDVGDWVVRQPGGEVQHVKAHKFDDIYLSEEEATRLGLVLMNQEQFSTWAIAQVRALTRT